MQRTLFTLIVLTTCTTSLAADTPKVLVAPFPESGSRPASPWVGRAIQRALVIELTETGAAQPTAAGEHVRLSLDEKHRAAVINAGKSEGAAYVVVGTFEVIDGQLLVTGQTFKVDDGRAVGAIDATGTLRDLFRVQAEVGEQVKLALAGTPARATPQRIASRDSSNSGQPSALTGRALDRAVTHERIDVDHAVSRSDARDDGDTGPLVFIPHRSRDRGRNTSAEELTLAQTPGAVAQSAPKQGGNTLAAGPGNAIGGNSGNTIGGGGLSIVNTPGNVISGGSGNIFFSGSGNVATTAGGHGNFIDGGDGNGITQSGFNQIIGGDAHVMQGGDGNYIEGGSGNTIQSGLGNSAGGIAGNTVGAGAGNANTGGGNTVRGGAGNTNGR